MVDDGMKPALEQGSAEPSKGGASGTDLDQHVGMAAAPPAGAAAEQAQLEGDDQQDAGRHGSRGLRQSGSYSTQDGPSSHSQPDGDGDGDGDDQSNMLQKAKRNARQQEQNKQAQQRYRAKRKAQFNNMQHTIEELTGKLEAAQDREKRLQAMELEMVKLKSTIVEKNAALVVSEITRTLVPPAAGALTSFRASLDRPGVPTKAAAALAPSASSLPAAAPAPAAIVSPVARRAAPAPPPAATVFYRPPAPPAPMPPAAAAAPRPPTAQRALPAQPPPAAAPPAQPQPQPQVVPTQVQWALQLFYQDLQAFSASMHLDVAPVTGEGLSPEAFAQLSQLVSTGTQLVRAVLGASGPGATQLLQGGGAAPPQQSPGGASEAPGSLPADSAAQWAQVAARLQLTLGQRAALAAWRERYVQRVDEIYGRRLLLKAQAVQLPSPGKARTLQWAESALLEAASSAGYASPLAALVELDGLLTALCENVQAERSAASEMMSELLGQVLTPVQAARYLLAGHPFTWNGLAMANAAAALAD